MSVFGFSYSMLRIPKVQSILAAKATAWLSSELNTKVSIGKVRITFFMDMVLEDIYIGDHQGNTFASAGRLIINIGRIRPATKTLYLDELHATDLIVDVHKYKNDSVYNYNSLISYFATDTSSSGFQFSDWKIICRKLQVQSTAFTYHNENKSGKPEGMDYHFIKIDSINGLIKNIKIEADTFNFIVLNLSGNEQSGISLRDLSGVFRLSPVWLKGETVKAKTEKSSADMDFVFNYRNYWAWENFNDSIYMAGNIRPSYIDLAELAPFSPTLSSMHNVIYFAGQIKGPVVDLKSDNMRFQYGKSTAFEGSARLSGLPEIEETFIRLKINSLTTSKDDIEGFKLPGEHCVASYITLPKSLKSVGFIRVSGEFTGFFNDFLANAKISTGLGNLKTNLGLRQDENGLLNYDGRLALQNFQLGKFLMLDPTLGRITADAMVEGKGTKLEDALIKLSGEINAVEINGYNYTNTSIQGEFAEKRFSGHLLTKDPNVNFSFDGTIDLESDIPEFDFMASLENAKIQKLGIIHRDDEDASLSVKVFTKFRANSIDNIEGSIELYDISYLENNKNYLGRKITLITIPETDDSKRISLRSDFADVDIRGKIYFSKIAESVQLFVNNYLESFKLRHDLVVRDSTGQNFNYQIQIKNTDVLTKLFIPDWKIAPNTKLSGYFDTEGRSFLIEGVSPEIGLYGIKLKDIKFSSQTQNNLISVYNSIQKVLFIQGDEKQKEVSADSLVLMANILNDSIFFSTVWNDFGPSEKNTGDMEGFFSFSSGPAIDFKLTKGLIRIDDTLWIINPQNKIVFDTGHTQIHKFGLYTGKQHLVFDGEIGNDSSMVLKGSFNEFNVSSLDPLLKPFDIDIDGYLSGNIDFNELRNRPRIIASLQLNQFHFNRQNLGTVNATSVWDNAGQFLQIDARALLAGKHFAYSPVYLRGYYYPEDKTQNFDIDLGVENLGLASFGDFTKDIISNLEGFLSGNVHLSGTKKLPQIEGKVKFIRTGFRINYLNTFYSFTNEIELKKNSILIPNLILTDSLGNKATCSGFVSHNNLSNFYIDLTMRPEKLSMLNTNSTHNRYFYGQLAGSGLLRITGPPDNINMDISTTTHRGTAISVPLNNSMEIQESSFVVFKNKKDEHLKEANASVFQPNVQGFSMNFDLNITPDARIEINLPSNAGLIESRGEGNLKMDISSKGDFDLSGEYRISSGNFLFRLKNVISRLLEIEPGSSIKFSGNPYDAEIDLEASYLSRTTLSGLGLELDSSITGIRVPVKSIIQLRKKLINPEIKFRIEFPKLDETFRQIVYSKLDTTNEVIMTQQFISLLVLNNFSFTVNNSSLGNSLGISSFQVISNQVSNLLSQISREFDIGVNYRPGDAISSQELELAMRTQLFDNRVTIDGNLGVRGDENTRRTSNVVGDILVEVKLTDDGKLRVKGFNRSNEIDLLNYTAPYTQGIGIFYRKEFNTVLELFRRKKNPLDLPLEIVP